MRMLQALFALIALCAMAGAQAVEVRAWLDRDSVHMGETLTLNVEATGSVTASPDFSALSTDFDQLGTSSSSSVNIVNGSTTAKQLWAVGLQAKHEGHIPIPSITVGNASSQPLTLTVLPAPAASSGHAGDEVFLEMQADPLTPYVQQQVRITVALYFAVNLADGNLEEPHVDGAVVQKLGQDRNYQAQRDGHAYRVIERHYALLPEKSGALALRALNFRGRAIGNDPTASFFGRGREIGAQSESISLQVRARPAAAPAGAWLPAQSMDYAVQGPDASFAAKVGEPITFTATVRAQGLGFEQLPELTMPKIDGAEVYPDKPVTRTRDDGTWLFGDAERKFAVVPTRPGTLHIPESTLTWWNTAQDKAETIIVPARDIDVAAAANAAPGSGDASTSAQAGSANTAPAISAGDAPTLHLESSDQAVGEALRWRTLAMGAFALWLITLAAWWAMYRRAPTMRAPAPVAAAINPGMREAKARFERACREGDTASIANSLLAWAKAEGRDVPHLGALAESIGDAQQREMLRALERARFGGGDAPAPDAINKVFTNGFFWLRENTQTAVPSVLPRLYP